VRAPLGTDERFIAAVGAGLSGIETGGVRAALG